MFYLPVLLAASFRRAFLSVSDFRGLTPQANPSPMKDPPPTSGAVAAPPAPEHCDAQATKTLVESAAPTRTVRVGAKVLADDIRSKAH